jgi:hypothetical protein
MNAKQYIQLTREIETAVMVRQEEFLKEFCLDYIDWNLEEILIGAAVCHLEMSPDTDYQTSEFTTVATTKVVEWALASKHLAYEALPSATMIAVQPLIQSPKIVEKMSDGVHPVSPEIPMMKGTWDALEKITIVASKSSAAHIKI